jgi:hypothetical protein
MDCVLAGAEAHRGRSLNSVVRHQSMEPPDTLEKWIRFVCGFVCGGILSFYLLGKGHVRDPVVFLGLTAAIAISFGYAAMKFGDSFWHSLSKWKFWWW